MRRMLTVLPLVCFLFLISGCGNKGPLVRADNAQATPRPAATSSTPATAASTPRPDPAG
jgi:predicted small lipoprotein YifL